MPGSLMSGYNHEPLRKEEIFKEAKRCHYQVPSDYEKILEKAQKVNTISDDGHKL